MRSPVVVVGMGEVGMIFAKGFLREGYPVFPILRGMNLEAEASCIPRPELVLVAVREEDLSAVLKECPVVWRDALGLVQNELLPADWQTHGLPHPTVVGVWFEKRKGKPVAPYFPSPVFGPHTETAMAALGAVDVEARRVSSAEEMLFELARKNTYIISKNIAGLVEEGTVGELWANHRELLLEVANEVLAIQIWRAGVELEKERLLNALKSDIEALPLKGTAGASALARLGRAVYWADQAGLAVPRIRSIQTRVGGSSAG